MHKRQANLNDNSLVGTAKYSPIAQLVERLTVNQNVRGSNPRRGANHAVVSLVAKPRVVIPLSRVRFPYFCPFIAS